MTDDYTAHPATRADLARRRAVGATAAGLGVMAANRRALRLYLGIGLEISREYRFCAPPPLR